MTIEEKKGWQCHPCNTTLKDIEDCAICSTGDGTRIKIVRRGNKRIVVYLFKR